ncbi:hypothetical protein BZA02_10339 [Ruegeria sp. P4]|nr:hypothetical protein BZA02_10339 [Ruegeria sp. P4]
MRNIGRDLPVFAATESRLGRRAGDVVATPRLQRTHYFAVQHFQPELLAR